MAAAWAWRALCRIFFCLARDARFPYLSISSLRVLPQPRWHIRTYTAEEIAGQLSKHLDYTPTSLPKSPLQVKVTSAPLGPAIITIVAALSSGRSGSPRFRAPLLQFRVGVGRGPGERRQRHGVAVCTALYGTHGPGNHSVPSCCTRCFSGDGLPTTLTFGFLPA